MSTRFSSRELSTTQNPFDLNAHTTYELDKILILRCRDYISLIYLLFFKIVNTQLNTLTRNYNGNWDR